MGFSEMVKIWVVAFVMLAASLPLRAQDRLSAELVQYQREADPVRKARVLAKMGDDQVELAKNQLKSGTDVDSLHTLELYRDEVQDTVAKLKATGVDPEKRPSGFKELQISLRVTVRHIDDLIFTLPVDKRPFFQAVRDDVAKVQNDIMNALFPRTPEQNPRTQDQ
jgi:hypothetical protein